MKYLTEIRDKNGKTLPFLFDKIENIGKYSFSADDTETQKTVDNKGIQKAVDDETQMTVDDPKDFQPIHSIGGRGLLLSYSFPPILPSPYDCLGLTTVMFEDGYGQFDEESDGEHEYVVAAVQNKNAAQLCKYIKSAKTDWELPDRRSDADTCYLYKHENFELPKDAETRTLVIYSSPVTIELCGPCGSVVMWSDPYNGFYNYKCQSLYDFLIEVCKLTRLDIMAYKTVQFIPEDVFAPTEITFHHGKEANRFFTKMYMLDAVKK